MTTIAALIVAGGRGTRMGSPLPKQYHRIKGKPILRHTLDQFLSHPAINVVQVVIHPEDETLFAQATKDLAILPPVHGGDTRCQSVWAGLQALSQQKIDYVLIHDAVRPHVSRDLLDRLIGAVKTHQAVCPGLPVTDTIRYYDQATPSKTLDRTHLWAVQTPQLFAWPILWQAYQNRPHDNFTDDAAVVEAQNVSVTMIEGDRDNQKITYAQDLMKHSLKIKVGMGIDVHRLVPSAQGFIILGGVKIPHDHELEGHSDADVILHALTDALLGSISEGDIGMYFPPSDPQWQGASSDRFVKHALDLMQQKGGTIQHVDITLLAEKPKIGPYRDAIRQTMADLLQIGLNNISLKATTTEKLGFVGREEGITAQVIVTMEIQCL